MSTTANAVAPGAPPAKKSGKKKLLIVALAAVVLLVLAAAAAVWLLRGQAQADDTDEAPSAHGAAAAWRAKGAPPVFMPLEPFTVNLADKDTDRYAQIAVTLEIEDSHFGDQLRQYMPAIRNNILMALARKTAAELLTPEGKEKLARQIQRETLRPLGISVDDPADDAADDPARRKTRHRKAAPPAYPVRSVQFASFIIQ
jgi:flagellar FliL protein